MSKVAKKIAKVCLAKSPFNLTNFFLDKKFQNSDFEVFDIFNKASYLKTYVYKLNIHI